MKTFGKCIAIYLIFMTGTLFFIHVDRQGAMLEVRGPTVIQKIENFIEK